MGKKEQIRYCRKCGAKLNVPGGECLSCRAKMQISSGEKNEILSVVLSFLLPGLGQLYNGQKIKALIAFIVIFFFPFSSIFNQIGIIISILMRIFCMYDAYITSNYINHGKSTEDTIGDFFKFIR